MLHFRQVLGMRRYAPDTVSTNMNSCNEKQMINVPS